LLSVVTLATEQCKLVHTRSGKALLLVYPSLLWATGRKRRLTATFCIEENSGRCITLCMHISNYRNYCCVIRTVRLGRAQ
jgi:hypothetical protein